MSKAKTACGDCLQKMKTLPSNSVDSVVTDPPYGLAFMGKKWDYDVPSVEVWQECLRVLKPGGHLLAFAGTRTQHRMAVRIEDAGFEIRDMIAWVYGSGFSKGFNLSRVESCECGANPIPCTHTVKEGADGKSQTEHDMPGLRETNLSTTERVEEKRHPLLQSHMQQQAAGVQSNAQARSDCQAGKQNAGQEQSGMEGRGVHRAGQGLSNDPQSEASTGEAERLCAGTHTGGGTNAGQATAGRRGSSSHQPQQGGQQAGEPESVQQSPGALDAGALQGRGQCERCGKLKSQLKGWSSSLKPALEPITVARKPFPGTVAANVLEHGTGAMNIDGCRVGTEERTDTITENGFGSNFMDDGWRPSGKTYTKTVSGRFPANLIHDGSEEVVGLFPESNGQGSAARFFYCAKANKKDRGTDNKHPTVKPTELMKYLCRLVTPPNGTVLDPFMGSGSTGKACMLEGFNFIGIELCKEYYVVARNRIAEAKESL
jgi:DNA modification methylase